MQCEICAKIMDHGKKVRLEGSVMTACDECAKSGTVIREISTRKPDKKKDASAGFKFNDSRVAIKRKVETVEEHDIEFSEELIENYADAIKNARDRVGLKQDELAKMINEPSSLIHRIESHRIEPSIIVAKKLENVFKIKLVKKAESFSDADMETKKKSGELTLGDLVTVRRRK